MINAALVLEGGSLRSLYTAGVLDVFLEKGMEFSCVIGVSAGALTAANYISKQKRRTAKINILHSNDSNYYGLNQLLLKRNAFNFNYLFNEPINSRYPFDMNAFNKSNQSFYICATDCRSGKPLYFKKNQNYKVLTKYLRASCSMPILADTVNIGGREFLDGGITEPIGIRKAINEAYDKIVVVLTRERNFLKGNNKVLETLFKLRYKNYPQLLNSLSNMSTKYNTIKSEISKMEANGSLFVIQPKDSICINKLEKDARKLIELYFRGMNDAELNLNRLYEYLK